MSPLPVLHPKAILTSARSAVDPRVCDASQERRDDLFPEG
jgi:hypothetical protein